MKRHWLLAVAVAGFLFPNGLFVYWAAREFHGLADVLSNHLALAFILDAAITTGVLAYALAQRSTAALRWPAFVALSLVGGLSFSVPFNAWLEGRK